MCDVREETYARFERWSRDRTLSAQIYMDLWCATADRSEEAAYVEALAGWMLQHKDDRQLRWLIPALSACPYGWTLVSRAMNAIDRIARGLTS